MLAAGDIFAGKVLMKPNFALDLSHEGIGLFHRAKGGWTLVGDVALDDPELSDKIEMLRKTAADLSPGGFTTKLVIPDSQILFTTLTAPGPDDITREVQIRAGLDGLTPYEVGELVFDWQADGDDVHVAVLARETLAEAEAFAADHRLNPVGFVARGKPGAFAGEPFFGRTGAASRLLGPGQMVERDTSPLPPILPSGGAVAKTAAPAPVDAPDVTGEAEMPGAKTDPQPDPTPDAGEGRAPDISVPADTMSADTAPPTTKAKTEGNAPSEAPSDDWAAELAERLAEVPDPVAAPPARKPVKPARKRAAPDRKVKSPPRFPATPPPAGDDGVLDPFPMLADEVEEAAAAPPPAKPAPARKRKSAAKPAKAPVKAKTPAKAPSRSKDKPEDKPETQKHMKPPKGQGGKTPVPAGPVAGAGDSGTGADDKARNKTGAPGSPPAAPAKQAEDAAAGRVDRPESGGGGAASAKPADKPSAPPEPAKPTARSTEAAAVQPASWPIRFSSVAASPSFASRRTTPSGSENGSPPGGVSRGADAAPTGTASASGTSGGAPAPKVAGRSAGQSADRSGAKPVDKPVDKARGKPAPTPITVTAPKLPDAPEEAGAPSSASAKKRDKGFKSVAVGKGGGKGQTAPPPAQGGVKAMTVFGARKTREIGGKPRYMGLVLSLVLLLAMAVAAVWSMVSFTDHPEARFDAPDSGVATGADQGGTTPPVVPDGAGGAVVPPAQQPTGTGMGATEEARSVTPGMPPIFTPPVSRPPIVMPPVSRPPIPTAPEVLDQDAAAVRYAATGIWERAPDVTQAPQGERVSDIYIASIDPELRDRDPVALPRLGAGQRAGRHAIPAPPAPPGTRFDFDERGLVRATPEGALTPEGIVVFSGRPTVVPGRRPAGLVPEAGAAPDGPDAAPAIPRIRPTRRPDGLIEDNDRASLGGLSRRELAAILPVRRPADLVPEAAAAGPDAAAVEGAVGAAVEEALATATASAVARSPRPGKRPANFDRIVARALDNSDGSVAVAAPAAATPSIPTRASVAEQATIDNALNLRRVNLIGVYGAQNARRALVRLPSGRFVKVSVGDRLDGGKVTSISSSKLIYQKGGRSHTLKVPPLG